jgi:hypothetical protein
MDSEIITALISGITTLLVAIGTWLVTAKKDRAENKEFLMKSINEVKDDITGINANVQQHIAIIDLKIDELSNRVEKHNNVIERTYALEKAMGILENRESVSEHRLADLEHKG